MMAGMTVPSWDEAYAAQRPPPWDIGQPQPAFVRLADRGLLGGRLLDAGCGTGEQALLAAAHGAQAVGVDGSPRAIARAREKAAARDLAVRFEVGNALDLGSLGLTFDTVTDSGLFHVFDDADRARYVTSLAAVLEPGGTCYLMCFSDRQPGDQGPRRVSRDELTAAFRDGWAIDAITPDTFTVTADFGGGSAGGSAGDSGSTARAWLAVIRRS
jgi:SAM-dependent methyltransferase